MHTRVLAILPFLAIAQAQFCKTAGKCNNVKGMEDKTRQMTCQKGHVEGVPATDCHYNSVRSANQPLDYYCCS
ncbi:hypothetical protein EJ03DRAFT_324925 [Teratosphaeria nubilosa]|uniref:Uncharacterized protein n=1 Tax=Teratosphaeria nubilosa TaxID=161662 RepID=A0A6G1LHI5_9PEZI|nr:hypothetical protein EJ03DRAFT_324925 [Teratosphaeria nubilosa]